MSEEKSLTVVDGIGVSVSEDKMTVLLDVDAKDLSEEKEIRLSLRKRLL